MSEWTTDRIELLRKYHGEGYSGSDIASMLNRQTDSAFSRNAIIGKADRIGLEKKRRPASLRPVKTKDRLVVGVGAQVAAINRMRRSATIEVKPEPFVVQPVDIAPLNIPFTELSDSVCKFECTDAGPASDFLFCGHPSIAGKPYCAAHTRIARGVGTYSERSATNVTKREAA